LLRGHINKLQRCSVAHIWVLKMKRILVSFCVAALFPLVAQSQTSTDAPAKAVKTTKQKAADTTDPKKSKPRFLTRDQLRRCLKLKDDNSAENLVVVAEKTKFEAEHAALVVEKAAALKQNAELEARAKVIIAEQAELRQIAKEFEKPPEKDQDADRESDRDREAEAAKRTAYGVRAAANNKSVEEFNAAKKALGATKSLLDPRILASDAQAKIVQHRVEEHNYALEDWRAECADRPYAEADETAIRKEKAK
jgi:hypothetical protein